MSRIRRNYWKRWCLIVYCSFVGFALGVHYWPVLLPLYCASFTRTPSGRSALFYEHFAYRTVGSCHDSLSKRFLTIAILSSSERLLVYLPAILETWVSLATLEVEIVLFVEEKHRAGIDRLLRKLFSSMNRRKILSCLFVVKLKHVHNDYPAPPERSFYALKFLYAFYRQRTSWILRLEDDTYVRIDALVRWLRSLDEQRPLYIGQGATSGDYPSGQHFCIGGSGVILSRRTLAVIGPWLDHCLRFELRTRHDDVELGRCLLTHMNLSCTNALDTQSLFYEHENGRYSFDDDLAPSIVSRALILHPIVNRTTFRQLFLFYQRPSSTGVDYPSPQITSPVAYTTFIASIEFDLVRDAHYQRIDVRWRRYIERSIQSYVEHLQKRWHREFVNWTVSKGDYLSGYHRLIPTYGIELIVDLVLHTRPISVSPSERVLVRQRLRVRQPFFRQPRLQFRELPTIDSQSKEKAQQLNLVVVSNNKDDALTRFVQNFQREILVRPDLHQQFTLFILYFSKDHRAIDSIHQLAVRYPTIIHLDIVNQKHYTYNRGLGRQLASQYFSDDRLLFFLDVDMTFTSRALINTRRLMIHQLAIASCAVYFPIIYSIFSNVLTDDVRPILNVGGKFGLFSIYGFGNVAVRKGDLDRMGGWERNNHDWGVEDVNLFERFVHPPSQCSVFRAVEPGLRHNYHEKMCSGIRNEARRTMCYAAQANLLGSQAAMVDYLYANDILARA